MLRLAPAAGWFLAPTSLVTSSGLACLITFLVACSGPEAPPASKLSETKNLIQQPTPARKDIPSPFVNPNKEPPPPRSEPQVPPAELASALARSEAARKIGDDLEASLALRACANKVPQSVQCEGELAIVLAKMPRHKYEAEYYLKQAIAADDPALTADYYRRLGEALYKKGMFLESITAYERMVTRTPKPTADDYNQLAVALQAAPERVLDAAEALRKAYELDGTRHEWLRDQAILLGQVPNKIAQAIVLFQELRGKVTDPVLVADTDRRIADLQAVLAAGTGTAAPAKQPAGPQKPLKKPAPPTR
ncbi:MAG TPA: tetratricopeptide repeat protein [Nannocystis sp.]|jgi:tetratricopeptide (TPR) repeat protein